MDRSTPGFPVLPSPGACSHSCPSRWRCYLMVSASYVMGKDLETLGMQGRYWQMWGGGASVAWNPSLGSIQGPQRGPLCTSTLPVSFTAACLKRAPGSMDKSRPRDGGCSEPSSPGCGLCLPGAEQTWGHVTAARETCVFPASWQAKPS